MKEKGVNPVIASILLIVITMSVGLLFGGWVQEYYANQIANQAELSEKQIECSEAGFTIKSCSFDSGDTNIATLQLENTGNFDLNRFTVVVEYNDGSSDTNLNQLDLAESAYGNVYIQLDAGESPKKIKIVSKECLDKVDSTTSCS